MFANAPTSETEELVALDPDHPGFRDPTYRARRNAIARLAFSHDRSLPAPGVEYTPEEHGVWRTVWEQLVPLHTRYAASVFHESAAKIPIDHARIPQLAEVNARLFPASGFRMVPVAGLVLPEVYLEHLAQGMFLSTQYMRHPSRPLYTPEPDVIHELVGHALTLADPRLAELNRAFGRAVRRGMSVEALNRVYWYTIEFGLLREHGTLRAYGAGLLSSFGELASFETNAGLRPLDPDEMARRPYDPTTYQPVLYVAEGLSELTSVLGRWLGE